MAYTFELPFNKLSYSVLPNSLFMILLNIGVDEKVQEKFVNNEHEPHLTFFLYQNFKVLIVLPRKPFFEKTYFSFVNKHSTLLFLSFCENSRIY